MSCLKDGSQNTWNMRWFAVSAPPKKIELKKIHFFSVLGKLGVGSVNLKMKNSGLTRVRFHLYVLNKMYCEMGFYVFSTARGQ